MKHIFTSMLIALGFTSFSQEADTLVVPLQISSLQEAIDLIADGGVVVLEEGTYEHGQTLVVDHKSITIQGCCSAGDVVLSGSNSYRVLDIFGDEDNAVVVQNLTIAFGRPGSDDHASALKVHDCQATFSRVIIENNGGGTGNTVAYGSGRQSTLFEKCIVRNNSVENYAGLRSATVRKSILYGNGGWNNTGVLLDCESYNCTVYGNGGGAGNPWTSSGLSGGVARNCVFWNNSAQAAYNPESVDYCLNSGHPGEGNIEGNPMFVDASGGEFGLMPASPAVDAGDPNPIFNDADGSRNDMGAIALNEDFFVVAGCTNSAACNYDALAVVDDGSCNYTCCPGPACCLSGTYWSYELEGCVPENTPFLNDLDSTAILNSCYFDTDFDGLIGVPDLMNVLSVFGLQCGEYLVEEETNGETSDLCSQMFEEIQATYLGTNSTFKYYSVGDTLTWFEAESYAQCLTNEAHLASVHSAAEVELFTSWTAEREMPWHWIGIYQDFDSPEFSEPSGGWTWIDGSPLDFTNWAGPEPNNGSGFEHHGHMNHVNWGMGVWNDGAGDIYEFSGLIQVPIHINTWLDE